MTREQELSRLYEDRNMLELDIDLLDEELKYMEEDSEEWNATYTEVTHMMNEVRYMTACIESLEEGNDS